MVNNEDKKKRKNEDNIEIIKKPKINEKKVIDFMKSNGLL